MRLGNRGEGQRQIALSRRLQERRRLGRVRAEAEQRKAAPEQIERRAPVGEEGMRRAVAGPRRRHIGSRIVGRRRGAVGPADRRVFVAVAEMGAEREPFAAHGLGKFAADFFARRRALRRVVEEIGVRGNRQHAAQIAARFGDVARANRLALAAVGIEQAIAAPAFDRGGKLPRQIDHVLDAGIHAKTAGRRHDVRRRRRR